jgi:hypothetical protein
MKTLIAASLLCAATAFADEVRHVYRLDFVINETDGGKSSATNCTLIVEEKRMGEIKLGMNVPLPSQGGATQRADIGLLLRANVVAIGDDLLLDDDIEISGAKDASTFRKVVARGNALISQGKPALVASVEEPSTHKRYEVKVTATKLR